MSSVLIMSVLVSCFYGCDLFDWQVGALKQFARQPGCRLISRLARDLSVSISSMVTIVFGLHNAASETNHRSPRGSLHVLYTLTHTSGKGKELYWFIVTADIKVC